MEKNAARIIELYLDWLNNFLTIEKFAEHYGMSEFQAKRLIDAGHYIYSFDENDIRNYAADR